MEIYFKHHLRVVLVLLVLVPAVLLFLNVLFMHNYLTVKNEKEFRPPLSEKLQKELLKYRWINAADAERERIKNLGEHHSRRTSIQSSMSAPGHEIQVTFFAKFAYKRMKVIRNMAMCLGSILSNTNSTLHFHVLMDVASTLRINRTLTNLAIDYKKKFKVSYHNVEPIFHQFRNTISTFRKYFFTKDVGRYSDDLFFVSQIFHQAKPFINVQKMVMIDLDTKFTVDIGQLVSEYDKFDQKQLIGIAYDQQPQYRFDFTKYRSKNPDTLVGAPHPGLQGFNTGIVLFDFDKMRKSKLYNQLLKEVSIQKLCEKYQFRGYMGHQDFYTLIGMEHPELYRVLDCTWNRQLDTGWKKTAGKIIFEQYHSCPGNVKVYHGNGEAFIPNSLTVLNR